MRQARPPITCRVVEFRAELTARSARVMFDGSQGWFIEDDAGVEFRACDGSVLFDADGRLEHVSGDAHSNAWVKTPIQGDRMNLDDATGHVIGLEEFDGRQTVVVDTLGLRAGEDVTFRLHVDLATGIVLQMSRQDLGTVLRIEQLRVGASSGR